MSFRSPCPATVIKSTIILVAALAKICSGQFVWEGAKSYPNSKYYNSVVYGESTFVAVGSSGSIITSADGITWTGKSSGTTGMLLSVTYGNGTFVATGEYGIIISSPDGATWKPESSGTSIELTSVTYGDGQFVAVGRQRIVLSSPQGSSWTILRKGDGSGSVINSVIYATGRFMAVGTNGYIISSTDRGTTWTILDNYSVSYREGTSITYGNNRFVMLSDNNAFVSGDGKNWSMNTIGIPNNLYCTTFGNGQFVAVGVVGAVMTSPDGVAWTRRNSDAGYLASTLYGVTYAQDMFVAVGDTILVSRKDATSLVNHGVVNRTNQSITMSTGSDNANVPLSLLFVNNSQQVTGQLLTLSGKTVCNSSVTPKRGILHLAKKGLPAGTYIVKLPD